MTPVLQAPKSEKMESSVIKFHPNCLDFFVYLCIYFCYVQHWCNLKTPIRSASTLQETIFTLQQRDIL